MAYLDENGPTGIDDNIATWPAAAAPGNAVNVPAVLKWINDALQGANGVVTFPAAAAPANGVSLAEVERAIYLLSVPQVDVGESDIDDSVQAENTGWVVLMTIAPAAGAPLFDVEVEVDLAKATTGFANVETSATIQFRVARKIDGTNWRGDAASVTTAISGTNAAGCSQKVRVGDVGVTQQARIELKMSADATGDMEFPDNVRYKAIAAPTITRVAAA
jgi:hypothetical protein